MKIELTTSQKQAIESIDKSMLVTAGAGSGKTLVLVRRFVEILQKQPELTVHNLLAVTYTRKAAKEMRTRIKARLKELYEEAKEVGGSGNGTGIEPNGSTAKQRSLEAMRWHQCLADMDSAFIDTIHSLCQSILRAFTVEIGIDPQIEVLDEIEKAQVMQESIEETFRQIIASKNDSKSLLEHFPLETIEGFLQVALKNHLQFGQIAANLESLNTSELIGALDNLLARTQKQLLIDLALDEEWRTSGDYIKSCSAAALSDKLEDMRVEAVQYFTYIEEFVESFTEGQDIHLQQTKIREAWQVLLDIKNIGPLRAGGNTDAAKEMRAAIKTLIEKSKDYSQANKKGIGLPVDIVKENNGHGDQYWLLWRDLLSLSGLAQKIYAAKKMELGKLDFDDLIAKVSKVLKTPDSAIRKYYNQTLAHILVDEFQDTNPIQAEIISLLSGEKTTLFLIGDDKQSIYKFQGADVSTFNAWRRKSSNILAFEHSFRSQSSIVSFVNSVFSVLLPAQSAHVDYRAKYSALKAQRDGSIAQESISIKENTSTEETNAGAALRTAQESEQANVEIIQLPDSEDEFEGKAVAKWIYDKVQSETKIPDKDGKERAMNYGDFAVLTSRNSDLQIFESALSELGIPYVTSGGRNFLERQEIYDLENMLLFLSNSSDSHALLAVLRSPMFGLSDDIIHNLVSPNGETLWQSMQEQARKLTDKKDSSYQLISEAVIVLKRLFADLPVLSLSELVYRIIRETNYDLIALTLPDGKQRYKNIWKFYVLAKDDLAPAQFAQRLELSRQLSVEQTNAAIDSQQSVKLMTIHGAKGLEFPAVALPALSSSLNFNKSKLLFHHQFGIVLNTTRTEQEKDEGLPLPYLLAKTIDDDMDIAEKKRLLYVAVTRARDYLGLFIQEGGERKESAASWLRPLLLDENNPLATVHNLDLASLSVGTNTSEAQESNALVRQEPGTSTVKRTDISAAQEIDASDAQRIEGAQINKLISSASVNKNPEQLLEPVAAHLGMPAMSAPEVSSLIYRITPSKAHIEPNPVLVGKFFHKIMEYLPKDRTTLEDNELIILAEQFGEEVVHPVFKQALMTEGKKLLSLYARSKLQQILSAAKTICHEWSYYMSSETEKLSLNRPDLLLETADGNWYLIDYKTDRFDSKDIEQQIRRHHPQLQKYKEDFSQLTKIQPVLAIYFAQHGLLHEL